MEYPNCPFYGRALFMAHHVIGKQPPFVLFPQNGNQCGLIVTSHAPCRMEIDGQPPDWRECILVKHARCEEIG